MNLFVYARNCVKNAILCLEQALFTRHGRHAANAAYTHLAFAGKQSRHRAHNIDIEFILPSQNPSSSSSFQGSLLNSPIRRE